MSQKPFTFEELSAIVSMLRSENGCPWDKAQTHRSIRPHILEEAYEVNQAVTDLEQTGDPANLIEELGDLLFQILLQAQIAEENGEFTMEHVIDHIAKKMIHRHPHVFGGKHYADATEQKADWEKLKSEENGHISGDLGAELDAVADTFPALIRGQKFAKKTTRAGLYDGGKEGVLHDLIESLVSLRVGMGKDAGSSVHKPDEDLQRSLGEILFAICRFAEAYSLNAETALLDKLDEIGDSLHEEI